MKVLAGLLVAFGVAFFALGCDNKAAETDAAPAPVEKATSLTAEGQKFDPPVKVDAIPDGAWYCDMGTVHYARSEKGDATCPLCKMKLKEKVAAK